MEGLKWESRLAKPGLCRVLFQFSVHLSKWLLTIVLSTGNKPSHGSLGLSFQKRSSCLYRAQKDSGYKERLPSFVQNSVQEAAPSALTL